MENILTNGLKKYERNGQILYALGDNLYTIEELDKMDHDRQVKDEKRGYEDRQNHYYDKWYRYSRSDNGSAYDRGVVKNGREPKSAKWYDEDEKYFHIIEMDPKNIGL